MIPIVVGCCLMGGVFLLRKIVAPSNVLVSRSNPTRSPTPQPNYLGIGWFSSIVSKIKREHRTSERVLPLALGVGFVSLVLWRIFPKWVENILEHWPAAVLVIAGLVLASWVYGKHPKFAGFIRIVTILYVIGQFVYLPSTGWLKTKPVVNNRPKDVTALHPDQDEKVAEAVTEVFGDQPDMVAAAREKSNMNHWERGKDGKPIVGEILVGEDPTEVGVYQISKEAWPGVPEKDLGLYLRFMKDLYYRNGIDPLINMRGRGIRRWTFPVKIGVRWTNTIKLPSHATGFDHIEYHLGKNILVLVNREKQIVDGPNVKWLSDNAREIQFKLLDGETEMNEFILFVTYVFR